MLTSAVSATSSSASSVISSSASSISSLSSASSSVLATGIVVGTGLVAVLLFLTLLSRELVVTSDRVPDVTLRPIHTVAIPLGIAFALNIIFETVVALG